MENVGDMIKGCMRQDPTCQRILYNRYRAFACKIVFRYIYRYDKTNDIVTDGFVKVFRGFSKFNMPKDNECEKVLMAWLKKIMINTAIDDLRQNHVLPVIGGINEDVWAIAEKADEADQQILYKDLISIVKQLPGNYNSIFNLYVLDNYTHTQIAEMLGISISTSRSSLSRARSMLQEKIKEMEEGKLCRI
ncbi:MAG: sigma-70 family RNA polymerase sigma factor [Ferruginibacter sp.]